MKVWFLEHQVLYDPCCDAFNNSSQNSWTCPSEPQHVWKPSWSHLHCDQSGCISCISQYYTDNCIGYHVSAIGYWVYRPKIVLIHYRLLEYRLNSMSVHHYPILT